MCVNHPNPGRPYIWEPHLQPSPWTEDALAPKGTKPSAAAELTTALDICFQVSFAIDNFW